MLGVNARPVVAKVIGPLVGRLARSGVTPDAITILGTLGAVAGAVGLIATGQPTRRSSARWSGGSPAQATTGCWSSSPCSASCSAC